MTTNPHELLSIAEGRIPMGAILRDPRSKSPAPPGIDDRANVSAANTSDLSRPAHEKSSRASDRGS
jgi:hypothetical protein